MKIGTRLYKLVAQVSHLAKSYIIKVWYIVKVKQFVSQLFNKHIINDYFPFSSSNPHN